MIKLRNIDELEFNNRRVFYRVDYNVPLDGVRVTDTTRIEATIQTLGLLRERGARIVIASHLGRPKGQPNPKYSLSPVRDVISRILGFEVMWSADCIGEDAEQRAEALERGQILLLENLRFHDGEEKNDSDFAASLAKLGELYVNDAFGACHRAHASIVGVPAKLGAENTAAGLLVAKEIEFLQRVTQVRDEDRPFVAILGGAKIKGKIEPLEAMVRLADSILIGGGMANTFLAAQGHALGSSLVDLESVETARRILEGLGRAEVHLPKDLVVTDSIDSPTRVRTVGVGEEIEAGEMAVDVGETTIDAYRESIADAKTIFWNGPMGVFERDEFSAGTRAIAVALAESGAVSIVGGGESVEAVNQSGASERISHISTGGGASLEFIAGEELPGIEILRV